MIQLVRWFKRNVTRNSKNYRLVVCRDCYNSYSRLRKKLVRNRALYVGFGIAFLVVFTLVSGLSGPRDRNRGHDPDVPALAAELRARGCHASGRIPRGKVEGDAAQSQERFQKIINTYNGIQFT